MQNGFPFSYKCIHGAVRTADTGLSVRREYEGNQWDYNPTLVREGFNPPQSPPNPFGVTTRNTVIGCALSTTVPFEQLLDHILTAVQDIESLLISDQFIRSGSSFESLLIISSSAAV
jgi:hypothetical protein